MHAAPLPQVAVGGALEPEKHLYISRPEDEELYRRLKDAEYCNVLVSRQMGKTSLIMRTMRRLRVEGVRCAYVDVAALGSSFHSLGDWYAALAHRLVRGLDLPADTDASFKWSSQEELERFFRTVADAVQGPIILFLDEIDSVLRLGFLDDFFIAIRAMYNERSEEPRYRQLTVCLVGVVSANDLIQDRRATPYNVGHTLALSDFQVGQLEPLQAVLSTEPADARALLARIVYWTDGQPYLTMKIFDLLPRNARPADVDALIEEQFGILLALDNDSAHFRPMLDFIDRRFHDPARALRLYRRIRAGTVEPDSATATHVQLKLSGLVKRDERGRLVVRNRIYARLFDDAWVRTRPALRRARRLTWLAAAATLAALASGAGLGYYQLVVKPRDKVYFANYGLLISTTHERDAKVAFDILSGAKADPTTGVRLDGYDAIAEVALRAFWERRATELDERAKTRLRDGRLDEACVLAALAAVKRGGSLNPDISAAFDKQGLRWLRRTFGANELTAVQQVVVSPDGTQVAALVHTRGLPSESSALLTVTNPSTGKSMDFGPFDAGYVDVRDDGRTLVAVGIKMLVDSDGEGRSEYAVRKWSLETGKDLDVERRIDDRTLGRILADRPPSKWKDAARSLSVLRDVRPTSFSADGSTLLWSDATHHVRLWNLRTGASRVLAGSGAWLGRFDLLAFSEDDALALARLETPIRFGVWTVDSMSSPLEYADAHFLDRLLRGWLCRHSVAWDRSCRPPTPIESKRAWTPSKVFLMPPDVPTDDVTPPVVHFGNHGKRVLAVARYAVVVWDSVTGDRGFTLPRPDDLRPDDKPGDAAMSPDGRWLLIALDDEACLYKISTSKRRYCAALFPDSVLAHPWASAGPFTADSRTFVLPGESGGVQIWSVPGAESPEPDPRTARAEDLWLAWQTKFGLTVNEADEVVPLGDGPPRAAPRGFESTPPTGSILLRAPAYTAAPAP
jgi:hypothetical protein